MAAKIGLKQENGHFEPKWICFSKVNSQIFDLEFHLLYDQNALCTITKLKGDIVTVLTAYIAPDKAAYCVLTQFRGTENVIKFISVRTKTQ